MICDLVTILKCDSQATYGILIMPTLRLDDPRWRELEKKAVEITIKKKKPVTVPEVLKALIDKSLKDLKEEDVK